MLALMICSSSQWQAIGSFPDAEYSVKGLLLADKHIAGRGSHEELYGRHIPGIGTPRSSL
ncbi:MAG: hypothetical protein MZV63_52305 [Marinilabiliales bacterium]|nr:hypothetical protein [Marinilabiliales bacterium]